MHPIFRNARYLASYVSGWLIIGVLLAAVLTRLGLGWMEALALMVPLCFLYAFVCLSAWYVSRATPLRAGAILRVLASSGLAAVVSAALWLALARVWITMLGLAAPFAAGTDRYDQQLPLLFAVGVLLFLVSIAFHYAFIELEAAGEADRRGLQLEVATREAELRALRAQIDPHFLYNSLNSISALTASDPAGARTMCVLLGEFLRNTMSVASRERIRLADEIAMAERFLNIEQVRFGSRLQVERHIDEAASDCRVPPLILQPLVENAVTHGIAGILEGGIVRLDVARVDGALSIAIENPRDMDTPRSRRTGVGLENVRRRLELTFGGSARLGVRAEPGRFRVELELPWSIDD
jgi:two-component system, LytTR family, sensor histidine kinase AlgZ